MPLPSEVDRGSLQAERPRFRARIADLRANERWGSFSGRVAVVLSGGGALGVYQAGVLLALQDGRVPTHILTAQNMRKDLKTLHEANLLCEAHAADIGVRPEQVRVAVGRRTYRYLKTFTVCPAAPLDASLLAFDSKTTESAIVQGYRDGCEAVIAFLRYAREGHAGDARYRVRLAVEEAT